VAVFVEVGFFVVDFVVPDLAGGVFVWALLGSAVAVAKAAQRATVVKKAESFIGYSIRRQD